MSAPLPQTVADQIQGHGLILYDGECGFCQVWVQFVLKHDVRGYFLFAPLQAPWAQELRGTAGLSTLLLYEEGMFFDRSTAAFRISRRLRWPFSLARVFSLIPRSLRDSVYDAVAKRRHLLAGSCALPTDAERARFLG